MDLLSLIFVVLAIAAGGYPLTSPNVAPHVGGARPANAVPACDGFYDSFSSEPLDAGWQLVNSAQLSLTERPGYLRITTAQDESAPVYLVRQMSNGVGEIWSHLEVNPSASLQQAGIAIYQDENNWLRLTRQSLGDRALFVLARRTGEDLQVQFVSSEEIEARAALRLRRQGDEWVAEYRVGAESEVSDWSAVGRFEAHISDFRVGLLATAGEAGPSPVDFDDFCAASAPVGTPTLTPTVAPGDLTLSGRVYEADAGPDKGIPGATVSLLTCFPRRFQVESDADGGYVLLVPGSYLTSCTEVTLEVQAKGYETWSQVVTPSELYAQPQRNIALRPQAELPYGVRLPLVSRNHPPPGPPAPPPPAPTPELFSSSRN